MTWKEQLKERSHHKWSTVDSALDNLIILLPDDIPPCHVTGAFLCIMGDLAHGGTDSSKDLLELGVGVNVPVAVLLAVEEVAAHHLDLQPAGGVRGALACDLNITGELVLKLLLQLAELGGVPSSTAEIENGCLESHSSDYKIHKLTSKQCELSQA